MTHTPSTPRIFAAALAAALAAAAAPAQYRGEDPIVISATAAFPTSFLGNGITEVGQVDFTPVPGGGIGRFYACLSVRRTGGAGGWDILAGIYDDGSFPPTFTKNGDLDALNGPGDEFSAGVSNDLLVVACDTPAGAAYSVRASTAVPFPPLRAVGSPVPSGYVDIQLCSLDGVESIAYVAGGELWAADFDRSAYAAGRLPASNARRVAAVPPGAVALHGPTEVRDPSGEARAFVVAGEPPAGAWFAAFASSIHGDDLPRELLQTGNQLGHPAVVGGTAVWAEKAGGSYGDPHKVDFVGVSSARLDDGGGTLRLSVFVPYAFFGPPVLATALIGVLAPQPLSLPGIAGRLGLASGVLALPPHSLPPRSTGAHYALPVGPLPAGLRADVQAVMLDTASGQVFLGNNAVVRVL
jgi:hypothetical protein